MSKSLYRPLCNASAFFLLVSILAIAFCTPLIAQGEAESTTPESQPGEQVKELREIAARIQTKHQQLNKSVGSLFTQLGTANRLRAKHPDQPEAKTKFALPATLETLIDEAADDKARAKLLKRVSESQAYFKGLKEALRRAYRHLYLPENPKSIFALLPELARDLDAYTKLYGAIENGDQSGDLSDEDRKHFETYQHWRSQLSSQFNHKSGGFFKASTESRLYQDGFFSRHGDQQSREFDWTKGVLEGESRATGGPVPFIHLNADTLTKIQKGIDPAERNEEALRRLQDDIVIVRISALGSDDAEADGQSDSAAMSEPAQLSRSIERFGDHRKKLLMEFREGYQRYLREAREIGKVMTYEEFLNPEYAHVELNELQNLDVKKAMDLAASEVAEVPTEQTFLGMIESLKKEQQATESEADTLRDDLEGNADTGLNELILLAALRSASGAQSLRIAELERTINLARARADIEASLALGTLQNIVDIDGRISRLEAQWEEAAINFYGWAAGQVGIILVIAWFVILFCKLVARRIVKAFNSESDRITKDMENRAKTLTSVFMAAVKIGVWVTALLMILARFEVNYEPLLLATGGLTLAIGFGAQSLIKDFFSGFFIILENQFTVGDVISIDGKTGSVEAVNLRTTKIRSVDGTLHVIPNGNIAAVSNMTHHWSRFVTIIGVGYGEDPDEVREILNGVGAELAEDPEWQAKIIDPPSVLGLDNFGASSVDFKVACKTTAGDQWSAEREYKRRVKLKFDALDIEIPYSYVNFVTTAPGESKVLKRNDIQDIRKVTHAPAQSIASSPEKTDNPPKVDDDEKKEGEDPISPEDEGSANISAEKNPDRMPDS